jgi:regulator of protease activity HflC (stomatin/prohibitin superfamily)
MSHEHKHDHEHKHGHGHEHEHDHIEPTGAGRPRPDELDAAGRSLSDALRISFAILKVIMVVLVVGFLASGFRTVETGEQGAVLRFGQIQRTEGPGWVWVFPYPIDELIRIPVDKRINLPVNTFWYKETREDIMGPATIPRNYRAESLDPLQEGYCLTRSEERESEAVPAIQLAPGANRSLALAQQSDGSDYSIVHTRWKIDYQIQSIDQFLRNVYVPEVKPGQVYFDVMTQGIAPFLRSVIEDAVVSAMVHYTIDEALQSIDTIPRRVKELAQKKLDDISSGIVVKSVLLEKAEWPKQVDQAFTESIAASQRSQGAITQARTYAENTLNEVAGLVAKQLYQTLVDGSAGGEPTEALWSQVAGGARDRIAQAEAYRMKVVETAKANADYLTSLLPEYQKRPELVAWGIYLAAIEEVIAAADEKFIVQPSQGVKNHEIRILLNRDQAKAKKQGQQTTK